MISPDDIFARIKDFPYDSLDLDDVYAICKVAKMVPKGVTVLETGTLVGKSAITWALATEGIVYTIDRNNCQQQVLENAKKAGVPEGKIFPIQGNSLEVQIPVQPDVVYLDSDHDVATVTRELKHFHPVCKTLMCGHDYGNPFPGCEGVKPAVDAFYGETKLERWVWYKFLDPIIDVVSLFIGRLYCFDPFMEGLLALDYPKDRMNLIWLDTSNMPFFSKKLTKWLGENAWRYRASTYIHSTRPHFHFEEQFHAEAAMHAITENYNICREHLRGTYMLALEDDTVSPPEGLRKLLPILDDKVKGACGVNLYRPSITHFDRTPILWTFTKKEVFPGENIEIGYAAKRINGLGAGVEHIGSGHLGFTLIDNAWIKDNPFTYQVDQIRGSDTNVGYLMMLQGYKYAVDWSLKLKHYDIDGQYV